MRARLGEIVIVADERSAATFSSSFEFRLGGSAPDEAISSGGVDDARARAAPPPPAPATAGTTRPGYRQSHVAGSGAKADSVAWPTIAAAFTKLDRCNNGLRRAPGRGRGYARRSTASRTSSRISK